MSFKTIAEAFNHYKDASIEDIEKRAAEIKGLIESDPDADVTSLNIEITGLNKAKENKQVKEEPGNDGDQRGFNPITGQGFTGSKEATEGDVFASKEYRNAFFKSLLGQNMDAPETAAFKRASEIVQAEKRFNDSTNTAAVLPTQTLNEVISKARKEGGLISVCRGFNVPTGIAIPVATPTSAAAWHTEGEEVTPDEADVANVLFNGYEIMKLFSISAKVNRMSISAFESYLTTELNACVMETIADALVNGTGSGQGKGINKITWNASNSATYTKGSIPTYKDFVAIIAKLKRGYSAGAKWAMNNATLYTHCYGVTDTTGRPIFIADPKNESIGSILGRSIVIDDHIADGDIYFGNFNYMGYNLPQGVALETSRESSFRSGKIDYRAMAIADTQPIVTEAFTKLKEATS